MRDVGSVLASPVQESGILGYGKDVLAVVINLELKAWIVQDTAEQSLV